MGLSNAGCGFAYAAARVTMPQVMSAHGVSEPVIAGLNAHFRDRSSGTQ